MSTERVRTCGCGQTFVMRRHERTNRLAPITTYADDKGNVRVNPDGTYGVVGIGEAYAGPRYLNHFADCPIREAFGQNSRGR